MLIGGMKKRSRCLTGGLGRGPVGGGLEGGGLGVDEIGGCKDKLNHPLIDTRSWRDCLGGAWLEEKST